VEGHIIPGLEGALYEMGIGESKNLVIALRQATEEEISHGHVHED
jgi:FKBP-type peptidyl-prolyl cis-trans isomerase 2